MPDVNASASTHPDENCVLIDYISALVGRIPDSREQAQAQPEARIRSLANGAAFQAAVTSAALALPPGPFGWLTILPDVAAIWRTQAQLVADIASLHGKTHLLTRENLLYCLFRHSDAQAVRELVVQVGERLLVRVGSARVLESVIRRIGARLSRRVVGTGMLHFLPVVGAIGVGAFAYHDTAEVGRTAARFFAGDIAVEDAFASVVSIKAHNGLYVCCGSDTAAALAADCAEKADCGRFKVVPVEPGSEHVGIQASNGRWCCCDGDDGCRIAANRERRDAWETFKLERIDEYAFSLRAFNNLRVYADSDRGNSLWADRDVSGPATVFREETFGAECAR